MNDETGLGTSVDVRLAQIQGSLDTMNAAITERLNHLADKMGSGAADLHTHVHHANPHSEQEDWLRRLIDSRHENLTRLLDMHAQENDRDLLAIKDAQAAQQRRADQQDGAIKVLRVVMGTILTLAAGTGGTVLFHYASVK